MKKKSSKKNKKKVNINKLTLILIFCLMIIIGISTFLKCSIFDMEKVIIKGNIELKEEDIVKSLDVIKKKNIFTYDIKDIKNQVLKSPYIENAKVKIKIPDTIVISIEEITPVAILRDDDKYCYISKEGKKIEEIQEIEDKTDKIIVDIEYRNEEHEIQFINDESEKELLYILNCIYNEKVDKEIKEINLKEKDAIHIVAKNNIKVILPNNDDIDYNISRLGKVIVDLKSKSKKGGTINLTYGNYALYSPN